MRKFVQGLLPSGNTALADGSRDACFLTPLAPLQQGNGDNADEEDHTSHQATAARAAQSLLHVGEPEGTEESPGGSDDVDEHTDAGAVLDAAVDGVCDEDRGNDLVADGGDRNTNDGGDVPLAGGCLLQTNAEEDQADHGKKEASVTEPQSVLGRRASSEFLSSLVHPEIANSAAELLTDNETDHDAEELKAKLLRIQSEFGEEKLRDLNREKDTAESENDRVGDGWYPDGSVAEEEHGLDELDKLQRRRIDTLEVKVLLLESRDVVSDHVAHVKGLGSEEEVGDELDAVRDCKDPVDPSEATGVVDNKPHEEGSARRAKSNQKCPHANVGCTLLLEEGLRDNTRTSATRRRDEERSESSADCHGGV